MNRYIVTFSASGFRNTGKQVEVQAVNSYEAAKIGARRLKAKMAFVSVRPIPFWAVS